ncbi:MAG TPA: hypothetical protein VFS92_01215, partial [Planctomycetota bacterium]|nr:hypothetical protein [Planctomycetota bacterium]
FHERVSIRAVDPSPETRNKVRLVVRGCQGLTAYSGLSGGLVVENVADVVVQLSRVAGPLTAIRDWDAPLRFDGNKVNSDTLEFSHREAGRMQKVTVVKCDVYSRTVSAKSPAADGVRDSLKLERCWFKGVIDPKSLAASIVKDGSADPSAKNGARIEFGKINDRPLELAGPVDR